MKIHSYTILLLVALIPGIATAIDTVNLKELHKACYEYSYGGEGVKKDFSKALSWCTEAALLGIPSAHVLLAEIYFFGRGVEKNLLKAGLLYEQAAKKDHPHAQFMVYQVNNVFREKESTDKEKEKGLNYLKHAVNSGYSKAIQVYNKKYNNAVK